jgi:iron complex outermembrane receptor protein
MRYLVQAVMLCGVAGVAIGQTVSTPTQSTTTGDDQSTELEAVVVTGTLIRGTAPIGTPVQTLDNASIVAAGSANTADILATVPALTTFNTLPIGGNQEYRSTGATVPGMRGLPGTAVLVMIDGHRMVGDSPLLSTPDPSSIPAGAIDHIEVLQDGGSATYGSDAVAGVINIILKKNIDINETTVSYGGASGYDQGSINQTFGKTWTGGSMLVSGMYGSNSGLLNDQRSFYTQNLEPYGGKNGLNTTCGPAQNFSIGGKFYNAQTLQPEPGSAVTQSATCDPAAHDDLVNPSRRYAFIANVHQDLGENVHLFTDMKYTDTLSSQVYNPQTLSVGLPGVPSSVIIPNTNPFFQAPPSNPGATSETVLVNSGAFGAAGDIVNVYRARSGMIDLGASIDLSKTWELVTDFDYGWSLSSALNPDSTEVNPTALYDAENGTTTGTALDPFGGRTNPSVVQAIMNWPLLFSATQRLYDFNIKADGTLVTLPGGDLKLAVGAANRHEEYSGDDPIGVPGEVGYTQPNDQSGGRTVNAIYTEAAVPIFGPRNELPGIRRLDLSLAVRYDHYSDFGGTTNPKYGLVWSPIDDISFRGTYGTSFHAPQLADVDAIDTRATVTQSTVTTVLPPGMQPGVYTIGIAGGKPGLLPETAKTGTMGLDFTPTFIPGFKANLTYFLIRYDNEVEIPPNSEVNFLVPSLAGQIYTYNQTAPGLYAPLTQAQISTLLNGVRNTFPSGIGGLPPVYLISDLRRTNLGASDIDGWDFDFHYIDQTSAGNLILDLSGEYFVKFATQLGAGTPFINNLTSGLQYYQNDAGAQAIIPWHARATAAWQEGQSTTQLAVNYTGHYNYGYTAYNYAANPAGVQTAGIQWVSQYVTVDLSTSYLFPNDEGALKNARIQLNVYNLLDQRPPFEQITGASGGFASEAANPLGRLIQLTLNKRW